MSIEFLCRRLLGFMAGCIRVFYPFCTFLEWCRLKFASLHEVETSRSWDGWNTSNRHIFFDRGRRGLLLRLLGLFNRFLFDWGSRTRWIELQLGCFQQTRIWD